MTYSPRRERPDSIKRGLQKRWGGHRKKPRTKVTGKAAARKRQELTAEALGRAWK